MAIVAFIDKLAKMVYLVGSKKEVTTIKYAQIFVNDIFWIHGALEVIISYQDPCFIGKFN